ncbi:hypothetical protein B0G81_2229 [Paraburkholderia sp. BL6665CI2N2]|nr:hypothetical protein B0G81_2229 [Paraburkholderia sp. BL6665CI2N2]
MHATTRIPFIPYSNRKLLAGDFWALTLEDDTFAAGCVLRDPSWTCRMEFFGGLLEWHSATPPTARSLVECPPLVIGSFHIRVIAMSGGIIGHNGSLASNAQRFSQSDASATIRPPTSRRRAHSSSHAPNALWLQAHEVFLGYRPDQLVGPR